MELTNLGNLKRTTIFLTPEQHEMLRRLAFEQRTSMAKLLRDAALRVFEEARPRGKDVVTAQPEKRDEG